MTQRWSPRLSVALVLVVASSALAGGCAGSWPGVRATGDAPFLRGERVVRTVDILPADVQIWAHDKSKTEPELIAESFDAHVSRSLPRLLTKRGYAVGALLDWQGNYASANGFHQSALTPGQVAEVAYALSGYGTAVERSGNRALVPHIPHRLGIASGADATLYVGGWGYAGTNPEGKSTKVLKVVGIILIAAVVVVAVVALAKSKGSGGSKIGNAARGVGRAGRGAGRVAGRVVGGIGRAAIRIGRGATRAMAEVASSTSFHIDASAVDCFGRVDTHVDWYSGRPDYYEQPGVARSGRSSSMIEMTLVDNRTGTVLWHARQRFPASPERLGDVDRVLGTMLASLPSR